MGNMDLVEVIKKKYKSLDDPDYSFVSKAIASKPYNKLVDQLNTLFEIEEITDSNDDVSFRYLLSRSGKQWVVELSIIGLYATILRISEVGGAELVTLDNAVSQEREIHSLLSNYGFKVLGKLELEQPIKLNLCNKEPNSVCVYQALFSDTDILPWSNQ